jgi:hypothetical protein
MKHATHKITRLHFHEMAGIDTAVVLFFLALEYGRGMRVFTADAVLMTITMAMILVLPYFLPSRHEKPLLGNWLTGRSALMMAGILIGVAFNQSLGLYLPESTKFMPMMLLITASAVSCYIQFYGLMRLHLAK